MSLYGSGRREGVLAVVVMAFLVLAVHALGEARRDGLWPFDWQEPLPHAVIASVAGTTFYRFLRGLGRSRYVSFLAGTAYALAPWFHAMTVLPREQAAAALAPLALEACNRAGRPDQSRRWLPWTGLLIGAPFLAGLTTIACLAALLAVVQLGRAIVEVESEDRPQRIVGVAGAVIFGAGTAFALIWLDLAMPWFGLSFAPTTVEVLAAHRSPAGGLDVAAFVRLPGPILLLFALLGIMRWQRHASNTGWLMIALVGAIPMLLLTFWPTFGELRSTWPVLGQIAVASWWTTLLAITVLGAAGLDDFLEMPVRRPIVLRLLLMIAVVATPVLLFYSAAPASEWPIALGLLAVTALMLTWRRLGILHFKNVLALFAVVAFAAPALQVIAVTEHTTILHLPSLPMTEVDPLARFEREGWLYLASRPWQYYSGLVVAVVWGGIAMFALRRRSRARTAPANARQPIA